ncbi:uncharacterized protein LOC123519892 [Portunus trituberculatus]|uniref:uncharacterized protein LOC123519892 n=1 Tax=Portunus trituberculatus TaxID=210409 RepID=UPI001E1CF947|nr:uncharacterized protein LOC123519892 [Portunus trituberculatus]
MTPENINEELILGKLVCGLPDSAVRHRLLEEGNNLTLDKAITIVQCAKQVAQHSCVLEGENVEPCTVFTKVSAVKRSVMTPLHESSAPRSRTQCPNCGGDRHSFMFCPARGRQCFSCGKWNHFSSVCRGRWPRDYASSRKTNRVNAINSIGRLDAATCEYQLDKKSVQILVNCGAEVNVMPVNIYKAATGDSMMTKVNPTHAALLRDYEGSVVPTYGTVKLHLHNAPRKPLILFYIAERSSGAAAEPILGLNTSLELGLITLSPDVQLQSTRKSVYVISNTIVTPRKKWKEIKDVTEEFLDVFDSTTVGDLGVTHHIKLKPDVHPAVHAQ